MKNLHIVSIILLLILLLIMISPNFPPYNLPQTKNDNAQKDIVDVSKIVSVLPKDAIPAISDPKFITAEEAEKNENLKNESVVLGIYLNGEAKAYPIMIMNWHEIVNDFVGGKAVLITYCPLCATGIAVERTVQGKTLTFGVSGKLLDNNLVMYDKETNSYWPQILGQAITGSYEGTKLELLRIETVIWKDWKETHPNTKVLSRNTGFSRDYDTDPYEGYDKSEGLFFPIANDDKRLPRKTIIYGIETNNKTKAYNPDSISSNSTVNDQLAGINILIFKDPLTKSLRVYNREINSMVLTFVYDNDKLLDQQTNSIWNSDGEAVSGNLKGAKLSSIQTVYSYWFSWAAFHPETELYS